MHLSLLTCLTDMRLLVELLTLGEEQIRQLEANLDSSQQTSPEFCKMLAQNIQCTFKKAITLAAGFGEPESPDTPGLDSPKSGSETPDRVFKDHERREMSKKRKTMPKWSNQVRVSLGEGVETPLDDGHSWRKYGQKDILGAKYPRGYYRCTHRNTQGCLATKQVQRSDSDPSIFDVIYRGEHTCFSRPKGAAAMAQKSDLKQNLESPSKSQLDQDLLLSYGAGLKVEIEGLDVEDQKQTSCSFSFPSTPLGCLSPENNLFSSPSATDSHHFMASFSPTTFIYPATSESNYFPVSLNHYTPESDLTEIISTVTSATNSPVVDIDFMLEPKDFGPFDPNGFFP